MDRARFGRWVVGCKSKFWSSEILAVSLDPLSAGCGSGGSAGKRNWEALGARQASSQVIRRTPGVITAILPLSVFKMWACRVLKVTTEARGLRRRALSHCASEVAFCALCVLNDTKSRRFESFASNEELQTETIIFKTNIPRQRPRQYLHWSLRPPLCSDPDTVCYPWDGLEVPTRCNTAEMRSSQRRRNWRSSSARGSFVRARPLPARA